jgi:hypothetical protein
MVWAPRTDRPRVLVENPDRAELMAHADILREAGYDVAVCSGPSEGKDRKACGCPLLEGEGCTLVAGADVVVSTASLTGSDDILAALREEGSLPVVFEVSPPDLARYEEMAPSATLLPQPVTAASLEKAVARARQPEPGAD